MGLAILILWESVHKKITVPTASLSAKTVIRMRDQGFEPWTP